MAPGSAWSRFIVDATAARRPDRGQRPARSATTAPASVSSTRAVRGVSTATTTASCFGSIRRRSILVPYKTALFVPDFSRGHVCLHRPFFADAPSVDPLEYPLDELLVISLLGQGRGVEIHGCGVVDGSSGYLFVGQSGAGKTTIARLWQAER